MYESGRQPWPAASRDQAVDALRNAGLRRAYVLAAHPDGDMCRAEALAAEDDAAWRVTR